MVARRRQGTPDVDRIRQISLRQASHGGEPGRPRRGGRLGPPALAARTGAEYDRRRCNKVGSAGSSPSTAAATKSSRLGPVVLVFRSVVFNVLFSLNLFVLLIAAMPTLAMPRQGILAVARFWARANLWLLRAVCDVSVEFRGIEKIPPGPLLVASKHQSLWETFALLRMFPAPAYIIKRELMWIPFFGWYSWKAAMIPVDRTKGSQALAEMNACARREAQRNCQVVIFPERTRR